MHRSKFDACILIRRSTNGLNRLILLQVKYTLGLGTTPFLEEEDNASREFRRKPREQLTETPVSFNDVNIVRTKDGEISTSQEDKIEGIKLPAMPHELDRLRALAQYAGENTRQDVCAAIQLMAPGNSPSTPAEFKTFEKTVQFLQDTKGQCLRFIPLDLQTIRLVLITDSVFANTEESKIQLGYVVLMVDEAGRAIIIHYGSNKSKRIARSVLAAELHARTLGLDYAFVVKALIEEILGRAITVEALIYSKTIFNVIAKDASTQEGRLQNDVLALREFQVLGELARIGWSHGPTNRANALKNAYFRRYTP